MKEIPLRGRLAMRSQQLANCRKRSNAKWSKYKGVSSQWPGSWTAKIGKGGSIYLGSYRTEVEAAHAYDIAAHALWGEFALLNLPDRLTDPAPVKLQRGTHKGTPRKLTALHIPIIRQLLNKEGWATRAVAALLDVSQSSIHLIATGKIWSHVATYEWSHIRDEPEVLAA